MNILVYIHLEAFSVLPMQNHCSWQNYARVFRYQFIHLQNREWQWQCACTRFNWDKRYI